MAKRTKKSPDFFEHNPFDPVNAATGTAHNPRSGVAKRGSRPQKRKVGFYISVSLLERFNRSFYELKLKGQSIENKSALLKRFLNSRLTTSTVAMTATLLKVFRRDISRIPCRQIVQKDRFLFIK